MFNPENLNRKNSILTILLIFSISIINANPTWMTTCGNIDSDNDGVFDECDWDDDNDGILDTNEGYNSSKSSNWYEITWGVDYVFESFLTADVKVRVTMKDGDSFWDGTHPFYSSMEATCDNFTSGYAPLGGADALNISVGYQPDPMTTSQTEFSVQFLDPSNNPITVSNPLLHIGGMGEDNTGLGISSSWEFQGTGTISEVSAVNSFYVVNPNMHYDNIGGNVGTLNTCADGKGSGTVRIEGDVSSFSFNVKMLDEFGNTNFSLGDQLDLIIEVYFQQDTDNDGIANHLDIDSDGDGCPDAIEGTNNFFMTNLNAQSQLSGNVDSNGVPEIAGSFGQDIGTTLLNLVQSVECDYCNVLSSFYSDADKDGIGDFCDIDDDNDGIVDIVELGCIESGEIVWDHNADGGTSLAGVVASNIASVVSTVDDISVGSGFDQPTSVNEFVLHGSDATTYSVAKSGHEYIQVGFEVTEEAYITLVFHGLVETLQGGSAAGEYEITAAISDDNFSTFNFLYKDSYLSAPNTIPYEISYNELRQPHLLVPGKHYTVRLFLYNEQNGYLPDNTLAFDDLKITISTTCNSDADRDGFSNRIDLDSDNDGIPDIVEAKGVDIDGNGVVDGVLDSDGDRIPDYADADHSVCTTGDGNIPQDGICDDVQGGPDEDLDGIQDSFDMDINGNGLINTYDFYSGGTALHQPDSDGDKVLDYYDLDADNDGIPDVVEAGGTDTNGDGIADGYTDLDQDGFNDLVDGYREDIFLDNSANALILTGPDNDANGFPDSYPNKDFDNDGFLNHLDLDTDNDGIPDVVEAHGTDTDGDGRIENFEDVDKDGLSDRVDGDSLNTLVTGSDLMAVNSSNALQLTNADADNNSAPDGYPEGDTDEDGLLDWMDLDADNDGIPDIVEAYGADADGDGFVDNFDTSTNTFVTNTELDADGFSNFYDTDTNNDGIIGDPNTFPLITTSSDTNEDGAPDNGMIGANFDKDAYANHLDLDADNDGITDIIEAGMDDMDNDGIVDDIATNDLDKNGWSNSYDGNNGGNSTILTIDSDNNGIPESYPAFNQDNITKPNFLDLDSDNDGIVDNTEAQATFNFLALSDIDADKDGIDDAYDAINGFGGAGLVPVNTDEFDEPDYLDMDSDNDGELDILEGHDTNGDNIVDANDAPSANNADATNTADVDEDGILDGFDNDTTIPDPENFTLQPLRHNDVDDPGNDRDWREGNCLFCKMTYAIKDGSNNPTTLIKTDPLTGKNIANADIHGMVRMTKYCDYNGWRYFYNAAEPKSALFAMKGTVADLNAVEYVEIRVGGNPTDREAGDPTAYTKIMNRDWFVKMAVPQVDPMDIRFYFPESDFGVNGYQAALTNASGYGLSGSPEIRWWKTTDWDQYDPTTINSDASNLINLNGYEELTPSTTADKYTGTAATDGNTTDLGNSKNYMQFDGLMNFSGGTAGFGVLGSALPVELTQFRGLIDDCKIHLTWTAVQTNVNGYYQVEWSSDGENFELLEIIPKTHSFTATQSYLHTHETTFLRNYYRLKMVNQEGQYTYSDAIFLRTSCGKEYDMMVYPNPVGKERPEIQVEYYSEGTEAKFMIFNMMGKIVNEIIFESEKHEWNIVDIDVKGLPSGTYYIFHENSEQVIPFTIQE